MNGRSQRLILVLLTGGILLFLFLLGMRGGETGTVIAAEAEAPPAAPLQQGIPHPVINEFIAKGTEQIELYNPLSVAISLNGWYLTDGEGIDPLTGTIPAGGYLVTPTDNIDLNNDGDEVLLYAPGDILVDAVAYGTHGGAPIAPTNQSTARAPNGHDSDDDAADWTIDPTPTFGSANDALTPNLGSSIIINEINNYSPPTDDAVELYNPLDEPITITNWMICDGDGWGTITTTANVTIEPGGFFVFNPNDINVYLTSRDVLYLFDANGVRVDQIGWYSEYEDNTFQRIPDGVGPNDGYSWSTSGAPCHWRDLPSTLGSTNAFTPDLAITKTGSAEARPGDLVTFTIAYENAVSSGDDATPVITDMLTAHLSYVTDTSGLPCPACTPGATGALTWAVGTLPVCEGGSFWLVAEVAEDAPYGAILTNTASILSGTADLNPEDNIATHTLAIAPNVSLVKDGFRYAVIGGQQVYTITVTNESVIPVDGVILSDTLPAGITFIGALPTPTSISGQTLLWDIGTMQAGDVLTYHIIGAIDAALPPGTVLTNTAAISVTAPDEITDDNSTLFTTTVYPLVSIHDIQYVPDPATDDASPFAGESVWVTGTVVAETGEIGPAHESYFIGEENGGPWSGLLIYNDGAFPDVSEGDLVMLLGTVEEAEGMTRLNLSVQPADQKVLGPGVMPPPTPISTTTYTPADPTQAEPYESVLVQCNEADIGDIGSSTPVTWTLDDGSGAATASNAGSLDGDLTYLPASGDHFFYLLAIGNADRTLTPRYDADLSVGRVITFVYHDAEDVVHPGESIYLAGSFNAWNPTIQPLIGDDAAEQFTTTIGVEVGVPYEYKYIVYTSTGAAPQWEWLNTLNRVITVSANTTRIDDYRDIVIGWSNMEGPAAQTINLGEASQPISGQVWVYNLTEGAGAGRGLKAEVGYGQDADPAGWSWFPMDYIGEVGNNDHYSGVVTPTAGGVYSYVVRYDGNWGPGNPNAGWTYADLNDTTPFTVQEAGVLTVATPAVVLTKTVVPTALHATDEIFTYTITAYNGGEGTALNALLTDTLPAGILFGEWVSRPAGAAEAGGTITWTGELTPATSIALVFTATLDGPHYGETLTNTATFLSIGMEPVTATAPLTIYQPSISMTKSVTPVALQMTGDPVTYTITALNDSLALAESAVLTDVLPDGLIFGGWVFQPAGAIEANGTITWTGDLAPADTLGLVFTATLDGPHFGETITNTAFFRAEALPAIQAEAALQGVAPQRIYLPLVMRNQ